MASYTSVWAIASSAGRNGAFLICTTTGSGIPTNRVWNSSTASPRPPDETSCSSVLANGAPVDRSLNAPTTRMTGGPTPLLSNAILVPSAETVSLITLPSAIKQDTGRCHRHGPHGPAFESSVVLGRFSGGATFFCATSFDSALRLIAPCPAAPPGAAFGLGPPARARGSG